MSWQRTLTLTLDVDAPYGRVLIGSLLDTSLLNQPPIHILGDKFPLRLQFARRAPIATDPASGTALPAGTTLVYSGKPAGGVGDLLFHATDFVPVLGAEEEPIPGLYEALLDLNTEQLDAHLAATPVGPKTILGEVEIRNAANTERLSLQFDLIVRPQVFIGNEGIPTDADPPYPSPSLIVTEAPIDGNHYARRNGDWEQLESSGSSSPQSKDFAAFTLPMTADEYRLSAKFTYTKATAVTGSVNVGEGATHVKFLRWDGTWSAVKAVSGFTNFFAADWGAAPAAPYNSALPKFGAVCPCNSGGTATGALTALNLDHNHLTTFDGTGLAALTFLNLTNNHLTTFAGTGLAAVTTLNLDHNHLTTFAGTGLAAVTTLNLNNNNLTTFDGTGLAAVTYLILSNNQLTTVLLRDFPGQQHNTWTTYALDLSSQNMTTDAVFDMLDSLVAPAVDQPYPIILVDNPCDAGAGPALVEDGIRTQAQVEALLTAKGYSLQLTGGTIAP